MTSTILLVVIVVVLCVVEVAHIVSKINSRRRFSKLWNEVSDMEKDIYTALRNENK